MGVAGTLLKNSRAGEAKLAWNLPNLSAPETLTGRQRSRRGRGHCCRRSPVPFSRGAGSPACTSADSGSQGVDISARGLFTGTAGHP
jgi:hypothetical protein